MKLKKQNFYLVTSIKANSTNRILMIKIRIQLNNKNKFMRIFKDFII